MNILAGHHAHDSNICYLVDGEVKYWNKLERLTGIKRDDADPASILMNPEVRNIIDFSTLDYTVYDNPWKLFEGETTWQRYFSDKPYSEWNDHHLSHAANAFYGSGFDKSYVLVVDRNGSVDVEGDKFKGFQTETLYLCEYPNKFEVVFSNKGWVGINSKYCFISERCGIDTMDNGKTMGLSAYGDRDIDIDYTIHNNKFVAKSTKMLDMLAMDIKFRDDFLFEMSNEYSDIDMANFIQRETNKDVLDIVDNIEFDKCPNLCFTGGHAHNCLTNYNIKQSLPDGVEFYVDPIPDDSNCSIGVAKYTWYEKTQSMEKFPMTDIYNCGAV